MPSRGSEDRIEQLEAFKQIEMRWIERYEEALAKLAERDKRIEAMTPVFDAALRLSNAREGEEDERLDALFAALAADPGWPDLPKEC